jgi:hypothetical protein
MQGLQVLRLLNVSGGTMNAIIYALPAPSARQYKPGNIINLPIRTKHGLQETLPFEWPTDGANAIKYVPPRMAENRPDSFDPQATGRIDLPSARQWSMRLVHALVEVVNGSRPAAQLNRWITPEVMNQVQNQTARNKMPRLSVRSIHVHETDDGVAEISSVFGTPNRSFALAMRLEGLDGRWRATSLMWALPE